MKTIDGVLPPQTKVSKKLFKAIVAALIVAGATAGGVGGYQRSAWPHWVDADHDCQDTRQEVLIRDAKEYVLSPDGCTVVSGVWLDPYTNTTFTNPKELDVDHLVPLKNAYKSGGNTWDRETRKQYANYLANNYHLIAVSASENRKKGEKGPEGYMPPNEGIRCLYVQLWALVKDEWKLSVTAIEFDAIKTACPQEQ